MLMHPQVRKQDRLSRMFISTSFLEEQRKEKEVR